MHWHLKTEITGQRIHDGKERILKLCDHLPTIEEMFVDQSPAVFYDHPFAEQEYIRNDPVPDQLLFFRKTANKSVDARRSTADPLPVMTALDPLSGSAGPCIKQLSDPDFFIKQFLVNAQRSNQKRAQNDDVYGCSIRYSLIGSRLKGMVGDRSCPDGGGGPRCRW